MPNYYYQFPTESELGKRLAKFHRACTEAEARAQKYAKRMGADEYYEDPNFFAGGVSFLAFREPGKVNTDVWRLSCKGSDGTQWFEPNVRTAFGCVKAREGFTPSDVAGRVYKKEPVGWDAVRQMHSLTEWLSFCGFRSSGDKEIDTRTVIGLLKDKSFFTFIDIIPMAGPVTGRKNSRDGSKAVRAEQMRMKLPTVHVDDFYRIVGADVTGAKPEASPGCKPDDGPCTPVFFAHQGDWFIGLDFPVCHDGGDVPLEEIPEGRFVAMKNIALRNLRNRT